MVPEKKVNNSFSKFLHLQKLAHRIRQGSAVVFSAELISITLLSLFACSTGRDLNYQRYYFQSDNFVVPKVYVYRNIMKKGDYLYWEMSSKTESGNKIFITKIYSSDKHPQEELHEELTDTGSRMIEYFIYEQKDSTDEKVSCRIAQHDVMKWDLENGDEIFREVNFKSQLQKGSTVTITKTREATGRKASFSFSGQKYDCVLYKDSYQILSSNETGHSSNEYRYTSASYYAEGLGLVEFHQRFPDGKEKHYKLEKIIDAKEFWKK